MRVSQACLSLFGNPVNGKASKYAAELQRPTLGLTERRGVEGGLPRSPLKDLSRFSAFTFPVIR